MARLQRFRVGGGSVRRLYRVSVFPAMHYDDWVSWLAWHPPDVARKPLFSPTQPLGLARRCALRR